MRRIILLSLLTLWIVGCAHRSVTQQPVPSPTRATYQPDDMQPDRQSEPERVPYQDQKFSTASQSYLAQGKRYFEEGYYKRAMHELLPLACDGNAEAQYAVGYMYYYGYGVAQDTDVGYFWIQRSADHQYPPAEVAVDMISHKQPYKKRYPRE